LTADVVLPGRLRGKADEYGKGFQIVVIGANAYFKVNVPARSPQAPGRVDPLLAGRWVRSPVTALDGLAGVALWTNPRTVGRCLLEAHLGTLRRAGTTTVDGQPVVIVADRGDVPGSRPKKIYIATTGPPLPLLAVATGRQVPGGVPNKDCGETRANLNGSSTYERLSINGFNHRVSITAPRGAVREQ
jgi:hypothetical protein